MEFPPSSHPLPGTKPQQPERERKSRYKVQSRACEACRAAKIRCEIAVDSNGICVKCAENRRECVVRTGPRTRRPKAGNKGTTAIPSQPLPSGPGKTFSFAFDIPTAEEPVDGLNEFHDNHRRYIEGLDPSSSSDYEYDHEEETDAITKSTITGTSSATTDLSAPDGTSISSPSTSSARDSHPRSSTRSLDSFAITPQFRLDTAERLMEEFRLMLPNFPCIILPPDATVYSMSRDLPFVLLAILAAASSLSNLQRHNLYDEEFRKVLALKFVAGGERSLELLQGIMIYCIWYPFHFRPKMKFIVQYLRMAMDIIEELELNEESSYPTATSLARTGSLSINDLDKMRALTATFCHISRIWTTFRTIKFPYNAWIGKCCDFLEQHSTLEQDQTLVWLVRSQYIRSEIVELDRSRRNIGQSEGNVDVYSSGHQRALVQVGIETLMKNWEDQIPKEIASKLPVFMAQVISKFYVIAKPILEVTNSPRGSSSSTYQKESSPIDLSKVRLAIYEVRSFLDKVAALSSAEINRFCGNDWNHLIGAVIIAYRLSLPLDPKIGCPDFDTSHAREVLNFSGFLGKLCNGKGEGASLSDPSFRADTRGDKKVFADDRQCAINSTSAFCIVLGSVKAKYERKLAAANRAEIAAAGEKKARGQAARQCPMFDGSVADYIDTWYGRETFDMSFFDPVPVDLGAAEFGNFTSSAITGTSTVPPILNETDYRGSTVPCPRTNPDAGTRQVGGPAVVQDLWTTTNAEWARSGEQDMFVLHNTES